MAKSTRKSTGSTPRQQGGATASAAAAPTRRAKQAKAAAPAQAQAAGGNGDGAASPVTMLATHEDIARKAYELWQARGCPQGQDEQNWCDAEATLRGNG